jgi:hypothetical protein
MLSIAAPAPTVAAPVNCKNFLREIVSISSPYAFTINSGLQTAKIKNCGRSSFAFVNAVKVLELIS